MPIDGAIFTFLIMSVATIPTLSNFLRKFFKLDIQNYSKFKLYLSNLFNLSALHIYIDMNPKNVL